MARLAPCDEPHRWGGTVLVKNRDNYPLATNPIHGKQADDAASHYSQLTMCGRFSYKLGLFISGLLNNSLAAKTAG
jgi:hypothetical protein